MGSPFPGMDPYIEVSHLWEDFHSNFVGDIQRAIAAVLPNRYVVRAGEHSYVAVAAVDDEEDKRYFLPDVAVAAKRGSARGKGKTKDSASGPAAQPAPGAVMMQAFVTGEYREPFLEIRQVIPDHKLITGIEVLSPSNKRPGTKGWRLYYRKRLAYLDGYANLVEIDLLRGGRRMPMASEWPDSPYYLLVCRKKQAPRCTVYPCWLTEPLPVLPIPLAPPDPDITLDLQPLIQAIYLRSRYERDIDYREPLPPPLSSTEADWLEKHLRQA